MKFAVNMNNENLECYFPRKQVMDKLTPQAKDVYVLLLTDYNMGMKLSKMKWCGELFDKGIVVEENDELWFFPHILEEEEEEQEIWFADLKQDLFFVEALGHIQEVFKDDDAMVIFLTQLLCSFFRGEKLYGFDNTYKKFTGRGDADLAYKKMKEKGYILDEDVYCLQICFGF